MARCITPIRTVLPQRSGTKKFVDVPCGKCVYCLSNKRNEWCFRMAEEFKNSFTAYFITLTYSDDEIPVLKKDGNIVRGKDVKIDDIGCRAVLYKRDVQLYIKNIREVNRRDFFNEGVKYFMVGEYSPISMRPHYHVIIFNIDPKTPYEKYWKKGFVSVGKVETASINYVTKYLINFDRENEKEKLPKEHRTFTNISQGLGKSYIKRAGYYSKRNNDFTVRHESGIKTSMPRYYQERIFNIKEREEHKNEIIEKYDKKFREYLEDNKELPNLYQKYDQVKEKTIKNSKKVKL